MGKIKDSLNIYKHSDIHIKILMEDDLGPLGFEPFHKNKSKKTRAIQ